MVSVRPDVPGFVLDGDVETFLQTHDPPARVRQRLQEAEGDRQVALLARAWFNIFHGSRHEAMKMFVLLAREENLPFGPEDIQAITEEPPVRTQT